MLCTNTHLKRTTASIAKLCRHWEKMSSMLPVFAIVSRSSVRFRYSFSLFIVKKLFGLAYYASSFWFFYTQKTSPHQLFQMCIYLEFFSSSIWIVDVYSFYSLYSEELDFLLLMGLTCKRYIYPIWVWAKRKGGEGRDVYVYTDKLSRFEAQMNAIKICNDRRNKHPNASCVGNIFCVAFIKYSKWKLYMCVYVLYHFIWSI